MYTTWVTHVNHMSITCTYFVILFYQCRLITLKLQREFIHYNRFMSAYEQRVEPPDKKWQYLLFAAEPYETISFKVSIPPMEPPDKK